MSLDRWLDKAQEGSYDAAAAGDAAVRTLEGQVEAAEGRRGSLFDLYGAQDRSQQSTSYPDDLRDAIQRVYAIRGLLTRLKSARSRCRRIEDEFTRFRREADRLGCV